MVASALASSVRPGWLWIQTVGAILGVALLVGACSAGPSPSPSSSASSTAGFTPINQMRLRMRVAVDGPGDARPWGGRVSALTRR